MKVLCVAEKPSIARSITSILAGGQWNTRNTADKFSKNYDFAYNLPPPLGPARGDSEFTVTSVRGHLTSDDFDDAYRKWSSCDPFSLMDGAPIVNQVTKVRIESPTAAHDSPTPRTARPLSETSNQRHGKPTC